MEQVACPDCDLLHACVALRKDEDARCVRCGTVLPIPAPASGDAGLALVATAAVLFAVAIGSPMMRMSDLGHATSTTLAESAIAMWRAGSPATAILVAVCAVIAPAVQLMLVFVAGVGATRTPTPRWAGSAARLARIVTPWAMPEVMLLATLVAYVKISELAPSSPGIGMYATGAVALLMALARNTADPPSIWARVGSRAEVK